MSDREIVFWSCDESSETLYHTGRDEAIEETLDGWGPAETFTETDTIDAFGFARMKVEPAGIVAERVLDALITELDEEYGSPEGDETIITPAMKAAAETFVTVVVAEYQKECWACECVHSEKVNVLEWVRKNRPDWLSDGAPPPSSIPTVANDSDRKAHARRMSEP